MHIETKLFGTVEVGENAPYFQKMIQVNGQPAHCGLYVTEELAGDTASCCKIVAFIDDLDAFDTRAREILLQELTHVNACVIEFLDLHLEEVEDEIKAKLQVTTVDRKLLLEHLDLRAIGFFQPEGALEMWLDYCPGEDFSDELLVVKFNAEGECIGVRQES